MKNKKLLKTYIEKHLQYYAKFGDEKLLSDFAIAFYEKDWRVAAVTMIVYNVSGGLNNLDNIEEYILDQIKVLDELINEK